MRSPQVQFSLPLRTKDLLVATAQPFVREVDFASTLTYEDWICMTGFSLCFCDDRSRVGGD